MIRGTVNPYRFFTIAATGTFLGTLEGSILNVALPTIANDLRASIDVVAWVVLAYSLTLVSLMMVYGAWAGRRGYLFAYQYGYAVFIAGTVLCALSQDIYMLVGGRVVQAVGSAMFQAVGMGLITSVFPEQQRGKAIGMMAMVVAAGLMCGPPLGGLLLDIWPWQVIFVVSLPVALIGLLLSMLFLRNLKVTLNPRPLPIVGAAWLSTALLSGMLWLSLIDKYPFVDWRLVLLLIVGAVAAICFVRSESRPESAIIGLDIFRIGPFSSAVAAMFLMFASIAGSLILVPFYLQDIRGYSPRTVGMFLIILPVTMAVVAPLSGRLSDRIGYRLLTSFGMLVMISGLYLVGQWEPATPRIELIMSLVVIGIGVAVFNSPNSSAMMGSVSAAQRPVASSILSTTRVVGMAFGIAVGTAVFSYYQSRFAGLGGEAVVFVNAMHRVLWLLILFSGLGLAISVFRKNRLG